MVWCERGVQLALATMGSFAAFALMTIAIGTDYWLYSKASICNSTNGSQEEVHRNVKDQGFLTHSGLWRVCCLEGTRRGSCQNINHFSEDTDYDHESAEYLLRVVRASSIFPILSAILLLMGGLCITSSRFYWSKMNIILGSGILFVAAGLSNIIGVIVYISANAGDPTTRRDEDRKLQYSYGWSFYFGGLSFIVSETVGVLAVNIYIEKSKEARGLSQTEMAKAPGLLRLPAYPFARPAPPAPPTSAPRTSSSLADISLFTLTPDLSKGPLSELLGCEKGSREGGLQLHNSLGGAGGKEAVEGGTLNRKTTPV